MNIPDILQDKLIEMQALELQAAEGVSAQLAPEYARTSVARILNLLDRALAATDLTATFRKELGSATTPNPWPFDLEAIRAANPGVDIEPTESGFKAVTPDGSPFLRYPTRLKFPVTPQRPMQTATELLEQAQKAKTAIRAGKPYAWPEHLKVGGSLFNEGNPADDPAGDCCESDSGPVPPSDVEVVAPLPGLSRQDLEDKLRIIAAIVDQQPPFGTELADFRRRLRRML